MVLEKLGSILKDTMKRIASAVFVDESLLNDITKNLKRALLEADVSPELINKLVEGIKEKAKIEKDNLKKKELIVKIIHDELVTMLGGEKGELILKKPSKILFV